MRRFLVAGCVACGMSAASPSEAAGSGAAVPASRSLCKPGELEFMTAWRMPNGPGSWGDRAGLSILSICASEYSEDKGEAISVRMRNRNRIVIDVVATMAKFEFEIDNGYDISLNIENESGEKYSVREVYRADTAIEVYRNGREIESFALFDGRGKAYVGRGLVGLAQWVATRRERHMLGGQAF